MTFLDNLVAWSTDGVVIRARWLVPTCVGLLAAAMVLSPVTLITALVLVALTAWAIRDLTGVERRLVLTILVVAIGIRVAMIAGLFVSSDPNHVVSFPFDGDGLWVKRRALWIRNVWLGVPIHTRDLEDAITLYGWSSWIYLLAYLQYLFGEAPYAVHLMSASCFIGGIVLLHRIAREHFGPVAALFGLGVTALYPSWIPWSVAAMRESFYFLTMAAFLYALARAATAPRVRARLTAAGMAAAAAWSQTTISNGTLPVALGTIGIAVFASFIVRRGYLLVLVLAVAIPTGLYALDRPAVREIVYVEVYRAATTHRGNAMEHGHGYELLDARFYVTPEIKILPSGTRWAPSWAEHIRTITWPEAERFIARAFFTGVLFPFPWQAISLSEIAIVPQQMFWYVLLVLAAIGAVRGSKTVPFVTWLFIGLVAFTIAAVSPSEGNFGTLVRHRDRIVPFVACLSGLGVVSILSWLGAWTPVLRRAREDRTAPATPASGWRAAAERSIVARTLRTSAICRAVSAIWMPSGGYHDDRYVLGQFMPVESLAFAAAPSRVARALGMPIDLVIRAYPGSAIGRFALNTWNEVSPLDMRQRVRLGGFILGTAALIAGPVALLEGMSWPVVLVWATTVSIAAAAMMAAHRFATNVHDEGKEPRAAY